MTIPGFEIKVLTTTIFFVGDVKLYINYEEIQMKTKEENQSANHFNKQKIS